MSIPDFQSIRLARLLEKAGFEEAYDFVSDFLIPLAKKTGKNLNQLMYEYANPVEDQDTTYYQLFLALHEIPRGELLFLGQIVMMDDVAWRENWEQITADL